MKFIAGLIVFVGPYWSTASAQSLTDPDPHPIHGLTVERAIELCTPAALAAAAEMGLSLDPRWPPRAWRTEARRITVALVVRRDNLECPPETLFVCEVGAERAAEIVSVRHGGENESCSRLPERCSRRSAAHSDGHVLLYSQTSSAGRCLAAGSH